MVKLLHLRANLGSCMEFETGTPIVTTLAYLCNIPFFVLYITRRSIIPRQLTTHHLGDTPHNTICVLVPVGKKVALKICSLPTYDIQNMFPAYILNIQNMYLPWFNIQNIQNLYLPWFRIARIISTVQSLMTNQLLGKTSSTSWPSCEIVKLYIL